MRGEGGGVCRQSASCRASADPIPFTPLWHPCSLRISYLALPLPRLGERVGVRGVSPKRDLCRPPHPSPLPKSGERESSASRQHALLVEGHLCPSHPGVIRIVGNPKGCTRATNSSPPPNR